MSTSHKLGRFTLRALAAVSFTFGVFDLIGRHWVVGSAGILGWMIINLARDRLFPDLKEIAKEKVKTQAENSTDE